LRPTPGNRIGRALFFAALACPMPSPAAADAPLGVVLQANLAHVKESAITEGATVYPGDELSTDAGGSLDLRIVNSRFGLAANSRAHFYSGQSGSIAELTNGTLTFRREVGTDAIEVVASDVRIVPKGEGSVTGLVTIFSPCKITVTSVAGEIEVRSATETHTVSEKETYSVVPDVSVLAVRTYISPGDPNYHQSHVHKTCVLSDAPNNAGRFRKVALFAGGGGAAVLVGSKFLTSSHPTAESPYKP
jgi:hypothetical protein